MICFFVKNENNNQVNMLREKNKEYGTIKFIDISSENYSPEENQGLDYTTVILFFLMFFNILSNLSSFPCNFNDHA